MEKSELIFSYFPDLTEVQKEQFACLEDLYREWNAKINVISRKDMDAFWVHHVLHSLAIAQVIRFCPGTKIMDVGTGGGFPGIPLAILFPEADFFLVDSIGKKIKVVEGVRDALGLKNVRTRQMRVEEVKEKQDFIVSRGVTAFPAFVDWVKDKIRPGLHQPIANGILYLKGGDFEEEVRPYGKKVRLYAVSDFFREEFFETKKVIHLAF
ncbi:16S rRNA (guanine(527)-N(7))-methyltransferase RsmG [Odoribacter sp. Z80]|uniref:16S rRNA (guanine(527)-N(7))-methyltransferase RsmG n=1 Tax=Odoribacter sp. Z80 TaxID=2304575 RepID=UPI0013799631|nr:16S rRNA (guanine(527)-N(7))-methyltransferase RsmG [Odoribacter sp. Z80]NCE72765.1 16S rRNA (guanine(527)-N(7))-methyltransferase RsmG [Odoribacter sp. Z80]